MNRNDFAQNKENKKFKPPIACHQLWYTPEAVDFGFCNATCNIVIRYKNPFNSKWACVISGFNGDNKLANPLDGTIFMLTEAEIHRSFVIETRQIGNIYNSKYRPVDEFQVEIADEGAVGNFPMPQTTSADNDIPF